MHPKHQDPTRSLRSGRPRGQIIEEDEKALLLFKPLRNQRGGPAMRIGDDTEHRGEWQELSGDPGGTIGFRIRFSTGSGGLIGRPRTHPVCQPETVPQSPKNHQVRANRYYFKWLRLGVIWDRLEPTEEGMRYGEEGPGLASPDRAGRRGRRGLGGRTPCRV